MKNQVYSTLAGLILISSVAQAEWLCTESSSTKIGSTITACGVGKSANLEEARNKARENAIHEFNQLCQISADCSQYDYNVVPKRTDCQVKGGEVVCFRAIDFEITQNLKKDTSINKEELQKNIEDTRAKIDQLQEKMSKTRELQMAQYEADFKARQLKQLEARDIKLASISKEDEMSPSSYSFYSNRNDNSLKMGVSYWDAKLTADSEIDMALSISYELKPTTWFGLQFEYAHGGDVSGDDEIPQRGTPGSKATLKKGMSFNTLSAAGLIYTGISKTYIKGEIGLVQATRTMNQITYSPVGTPSSEATTQSVTKAFSGVSLGYDSRDNNKGWGTYVEIGARAAGSNVGITSTVGFSVGF